MSFRFLKVALVGLALAASGARAQTYPTSTFANVIDRGVAAGSVMLGGGTGGPITGFVPGVGAVTALGIGVNTSGGATLLNGAVTSGHCLRWSAGGVQDAGAVCGGTGTVTSVGASFTGGIVSISGSPVTTSGTLAFTVAGTSGGVPYFSSSTGWGSSAALASGALVLGGGAGAAPATTTTGGGIVTALGITTNANGGVALVNGTPTSGNCLKWSATGVQDNGAACATAFSISFPQTVGGTTNSGGIPYFSNATTLTTSGVLAANSILIGGGAGASPSSTTTGSGVLTALGVNTGSAGAFVVNGGALGTPTSVTLTNGTGLPISTGVSGLGTGVATALAIATNASGGTGLVNGTPVSGNCLKWSATGVQDSGAACGTGSGSVTSVAQTFTGGLISVAGSPITTSGTLALTVAGTSGGIPYFSSASTWATSAALAANAIVIGGGAGTAPATTITGTGVITALGVNTGSAGAFVVNGGALGTPSSGVGTNITGVPLTTGITGVLPVANGGTNASSASITAFNNITGFTAAGATGTTSTNLVFSTSPTLVTPALGVATATSLAVGGATLGTSSLAVPAGSAAAPSLAIGNSTTGLYSVSTVGFGVTVSGISVLDYGTTGGNGILALGVGSGNQVGVFPVIGWGKSLRLDAGMSLAWNSGAIASGADTGFIRFAAATIHMGNFDAAAPVAQTFGVQSVVAGTSNTAGALWKHVGSLSTGSGVSGDISFQTGGTGAGAAVQNSAVDALVIKGATQNVRLPAITSDAALTDTTVCQDTTNHALFSGSGTLGICLGTSSARYKHDVSELMIGLHAIMGLQPKRYFLDAQHGDPKKPYYGFLAEDGVSVLPELVGNDNFGRPNTFDYLGIVPILVKAVQEQQNEIQALRREVR